MRQPVYFISHGGGPWPWVAQWEGEYRMLRQAITRIPNELPTKPQAILVISAHWITSNGLAITTNPSPSMLYDYYGFPENTYHVQYPAPGFPELAKSIAQQLRTAGFHISEDNNRGFDHGAFVPLALAFPDASIPVIQLSIHRSFEPNYHIALGEALQSLRDKNILIIASGLSFHNMRMFNPTGKVPSQQFDDWLQQHILVEPDTTYQNALLLTRKQSLIHWEQAPAARIAHPMEDHLVPLMIAVGAAGEDKAYLHYHENNTMGGITVSGFRFGTIDR